MTENLQTSFLPFSGTCWVQPGSWLVSPLTEPRGAPIGVWTPQILVWTPPDPEELPYFVELWYVELWQAQHALLCGVRLTKRSKPAFPLQGPPPLFQKSSSTLQTLNAARHALPAVYPCELIYGRPSGVPPLPPWWASLPRPIPASTPVTGAPEVSLPSVTCHVVRPLRGLGAAMSLLCTVPQRNCCCTIPASPRALALYRVALTSSPAVTPTSPGYLPDIRRERTRCS